jgi:hypothetical protein
MTFSPVLEKFANELKAKFSVHIPFNPEDQLKGPLDSLVQRAGDLLKLTVKVVTEAQVAEVGGRPDMAVTVDGVLAGHIELKAPGKGARTNKFVGRDKAQWGKFRNLPNVIYTDGNEWALYRTGERIGDVVRLSGDVTEDGAKAVTENVATRLQELLRDFLYWHPVTPSSPRVLAGILAPLTRLLRTEVLVALEDENSNLSHLANDWRQFLFPDADDAQFADAYAQTLTYALLLARFSGAEELTINRAVEVLRPGHSLLADALKILGEPAARAEIAVPLSVLERLIDAVDPAKLQRDDQEDPWLYFYEHFLAAYDPQMRKERGVYYTPVPVVQTQVRLVAQLLREHFDAEYSFVDPKVTTLDPAAGTGTYILAALKHGLEQAAQERGPGIRAQAASTAAQNMHAFELLVGPYAVAHLRLTQAIKKDGGRLPEDGVHVYLSDTLESPFAPPPNYMPLFAKPLGAEHIRAQKIKQRVPILVCIGNPPYDRQQIDPDDKELHRRKGGWVRYGDAGEASSILQDFVKPLIDTGGGLHAKNLYNDYVYFWRWALWKVFENQPGPELPFQHGIVSFITASSYLRGPGFIGMRKVMRQTFDELWIIDLEGDNLGSRKTDNVFAIQTPVAIAIGVRYGVAKPDEPALVRYSRVEGTEDEKLARLGSVVSFEDLKWTECLSGWHDPFLPSSNSLYWKWPLITDLFPWQENGMQFKRTWPIGENVPVLERRWKALLSDKNRKTAFKETRDRKVDNQYPSYRVPGERLPAIRDLPPQAPPPSPTLIAHRSFDRKWAYVDNRLGDYLRPSLQAAHGPRQLYMTSLLTNVLGAGPALIATNLLPDMDHFRGSFGAKHVIPLWRTTAATSPNITHGLLQNLSATYEFPVVPEDIFAYCYTVLFTPLYVETYWEELTIPGLRVPLTRNGELFARAVALGRQLVWLHTYGEQFVPPDQRQGRVPRGHALIKLGTPQDPANYPESFVYDAEKLELYVGKGVFSNVRPEVWNFSVSGLEVVRSWLGYRMKSRKGRSSSPLDDIRPEHWEFDNELLDLLWVLDATIDLLPELASHFSKIVESPTFTAAELPSPTEAERAAGAPLGDLPLFHQLEEGEEDNE